eukprot:m.684008 g.684008  ORF g.684008 m.684008 type:complete len:86 (-) comp22832_c0_seq12:2492-2749(-)
MKTDDTSASIDMKCTPTAYTVFHTAFTVGISNMQPAKSPDFCGSVNVPGDVNSLRYIERHDCLSSQHTCASRFNTNVAMHRLLLA